MITNISLRKTDLLQGNENCGCFLHLGIRGLTGVIGFTRVELETYDVIAVQVSDIPSCKKALANQRSHRVSLC